VPPVLVVAAVPPILAPPEVELPPAASEPPPAPWPEQPASNATRKVNREKGRFDIEQLIPTTEPFYQLIEKKPRGNCNQLRVGVVQSTQVAREEVAPAFGLKTPGSFAVLVKNFLMFCWSGTFHSGLIEQWVPFATSDQ